METRGCPTVLTDETTLKIREAVLKGIEYKRIQEDLQISAGTWDYWVWQDYQGFRANLLTWKKEKMIRKAEKVVDNSMDSENEKIALDAAQFTLETLGKMDYSKRTELTGKDGKDLIPKPIMDLSDVQQDNSNTENIIIETED